MLLSGPISAGGQARRWQGAVDTKKVLWGHHTDHPWYKRSECLTADKGKVHQFKSSFLMGIAYLESHATQQNSKTEEGSDLDNFTPRVTWIRKKSWIARLSQGFLLGFPFSPLKNCM